MRQRLVRALGDAFIGSKNYVLMYDVFGLKPNNMGFSETADFTTFKNLGRFNDAGSPMRAPAGQRVPDRRWRSRE